MSVQVEQITPKIAAEWLLLFANRNNQRLDDAKIRKYCAIMASGKWELRRDSRIVFSVGQTLLDGHHRLHAVVLSETRIPSLVIRGAESFAGGLFDRW